jgi:hypothetical protein
MPQGKQGDIQEITHLVEGGATGHVGNLTEAVYAVARPGGPAGSGAHPATGPSTGTERTERCRLNSGWHAACVLVALGYSPRRRFPGMGQHLIGGQTMYIGGGLLLLILIILLLVLLF